MTTNFWNNKRVLITGASGLVGSWLTKALIEKKAYVIILLRDYDPQSELIRSQVIAQTHVVNGALEDFFSIERAINEHEVDTVIHLGAQTIVGTALRHPLPTFEANIRGTYNLLEACRIHKNLVKRILVASSDKAYGSSDTLPYTEEMPLNGKHPYDVSKSCTDLLASSYAHTYGLPITIARCGNIYGGGDLNWSRIIPGTIKSLFCGHPPEIRSNGLFTRDYIYIQDVVQAYLTLAEQTEKEAVRFQGFNFGPNRPYTVIEIVETIQKLMDRTELKPRILNSSQGEIKDQTLCSKKAENLLGWKPTYTLESGLAETIQWYKSHLTSKSKS
jgi:CDP-glucose 4,6-dehydratase